MISMTFPQYRRRECVIGGRKIRLGTRLSKMLLMLLLAGPDRFVSRAELMAAIWPNPELEPTHAVKIVGICLCQLRRHGVIIESYYGVGWRIPRLAREALPERLAA